jgi:hypothetical protein
MAEREGSENLCLGYAAFVYYIQLHTKKGEYELESPDGSPYEPLYLACYTNDSYHKWKLVIDEYRGECGYVYTHIDDLKKIFKNYPELLKDFLAHCKRPKEGHCYNLEPTLKGKIEVTLDNGVEVACLYESNYFT